MQTSRDLFANIEYRELLRLAYCRVTHLAALQLWHIITVRDRQLILRDKLHPCLN